MILCSNHDFSASFFNIEKIFIDSISFCRCGKTKPVISSTGIIAVKNVEINCSTFVSFTQNSILIKSNVSELQVTNCIFSKGKATAIYIQSDSVSNATIRNNNFSHNEAGSIEHYGTLSYESNLVIRNCTFYFSSSNKSIIDVYSLHSVTIKHSFFSENVVGNILLTLYTNEVILAESYIESNTVYFDTICSSSSPSSSTDFIPFQRNSLSIISNTFINNNTNMHMSTFSIKRFHTIKILNCIFMNNKGARSSLEIINSNEIVINQTVFENNRAAAIQLWNRNILTVDYTKFISNRAEYGGAITDLDKFIGCGHVTIQRSIFVNNQAKHNGGAIDIYPEEIEVINSTFFNNSALEGDGGAMSTSGNLHITSSSFFSNRATNGGALSMSTSGNLYITSSNFFSNRATNGGALSMNGGIIDLQNANFTGNQAENGSGGAIAAVRDAAINVNNSTFINNIALTDGGVFFMCTTELTVSFSIFNNNSAVNGGAIYLVSGINVTIIQSTFKNNVGLKNGGAICLFSKNVHITHCDFHDNLAANGGGISAEGVAYLTAEMTAFCFNQAGRGATLKISLGIFVTIQDSQFINNTATKNDGGAVNIKGNKIEFHNCNFQENTALSSPNAKGGAINVISLAMLIVNHTNFTTNAANHGGALNIENTQRVIVWDCYFINNSAKRKGGAIAMTNNNSEINIYAFSKFISNSANEGGALAFNAIGCNFFTTLQLH